MEKANRKTPLPLAIGAALAALWVLSTPAAARAEDVAWLRGVAFRQQLEQAEDIYWPAAPLRQTLAQFSRTQRVAVLIDRRIDPGQEIQLQLQSVPIIDVFRIIAENQGVGLSVFGPVIYLGPPRSADRLRTLAQLRRDEAGNLPPAVGRKWLKAKPLSWDDFATPRELLSRLATEAGATIVEQIPHDLWAAADLPALPLVDRLTLILEQFDLTFRIAADGRSVELIPVPDDVAVVKRYRAGQQADRLASRWKELAPCCRFKVIGDDVYVRGRVEDHERLATARRHGSAVRAGRTKPAVRPEEKRFTAQVENKPLGQVLRSFAAQLKLEIQFEQAALEAAGVSLDQRISFQVNQATLEELFEAILGPLNCEARFQDQVVEIRAAAR